MPEIEEDQKMREELFKKSERQIRYQKMNEEIEKRMRREGRTYRLITEMELKDFIRESSRIIADGIIDEGFSSISTILLAIITNYNANELLNIE